jgi:leucyl/phenylalanyl-tRNA--protein transferase
VDSPFLDSIDWEPFYPPHPADPLGVVGVGEDLHPELLLEAYDLGIFPMPEDDENLVWMCPEPRAILRLEKMLSHKRLARRIRSLQLDYSVGLDFTRVMRSCGENRAEGTWITPRMVDAYHWLHRLGRAQSLEVWQGSDLVGGVYGVLVGSIFCAESMFSRISDGSKSALYFLCQHLLAQGFRFIDCQLLNPHTESLGAEEIPREEYLKLLAVYRSDSPSLIPGRYPAL